ncbi:uncharacterized protein LOC119595300 [Penaeus monodon]|uniref:uncharacterized protein LOC119595300 n=1 Tax=Penaeus monodon TaxID=6687 RepID=UPI0018A7ADB7|nr:uncharacterized protein LOC119595300 [Penaeus monodon]
MAINVLFTRANALMELPFSRRLVPTSTSQLPEGPTPSGGLSPHSWLQTAFAPTTSGMGAQPMIVSMDHFLANTRAFLSIFPATQSDRKAANDNLQRLVTANGTPINSCDFRDITIRLFRCTYPWSFLIADVTWPLLSADFLSHHNLLDDMRRCQLINMDTHSTSGQCSLYSREQQRVVLMCVPHIKTTGPPVHSRFRRLRPEMLHTAKLAFTEMERMGICYKAANSWASLLHMVRKSNYLWRRCSNYWRLNLITEADHYPMPDMTDLTASIGDTRIFSKLDLFKGYFQVPVYPDDFPKTVIVTLFGSFVFHYTFGLRRVPILHGLHR